MRLALAFGLAIGLPASAIAQDAAPDLVGTWSGPFRTVIFGNNPHHPGSETVATPPRIREITFTLDVEGQDGNLIWGQSWSDPARKEPFAADHHRGRQDHRRCRHRRQPDDEHRRAR